MKKTRIMVFGTFDAVHPGHLYFFNAARSLVKNPYLIVSIARDENVKKIKQKPSVNREKERQKLVAQLRVVDEVVIGAKKDYIHHIIKTKPEIIALGYDQIAYTEGLEEKLAKKGLHVTIVRIGGYHTDIYKTSKLT